MIELTNSVSFFRSYIMISLRTFSRTIIFTSLLVTSVLVLGMEDPNQNNNNSYKPLNHFHDIPDAHSNFEKDANFDSLLTMDMKQFDKETIIEMEQVFNDAPPRAQQIINHLEDKDFLDDGAYRAAIFWGPPGTGKTTTALAIAYKMFITKQWKCRFFSAGELARKDRNATAMALCKLFKEIETDTEPNILILDEMNELFEHPESEHRDTSMNSKVFTKFFNGRQGKHYFFCIGTANHVDQMDPIVLDRCFKGCITFPPFANTDTRNRIFRSKLTGKSVSIDENVSNDQLDELFKSLADCTGRDLTNLATLCKSFFRIGNIASKSIIISEENIKDAITELAHLKEVSKYNHPKETDAERQERFHKEQQELQMKLNEANSEAQLQLAIEHLCESERCSDQIRTKMNKYDYHSIKNRTRQAYFNAIPERRPANYQPLPESPAEEARRNGTQNNSSCSIQ